MKPIMVGNILDAITTHIVKSLGRAVDEKVIKRLVEDVIPESGVILEASKEELSNDRSIGTMLYQDVVIELKTNDVERMKCSKSGNTLMAEQGVPVIQCKICGSKYMAG